MRTIETAGICKICGAREGQECVTESGLPMGAGVHSYGDRFASGISGATIPAAPKAARLKQPTLTIKIEFSAICPSKSNGYDTDEIIWGIKSVLTDIKETVDWDYIFDGPAIILDKDGKRSGYWEAVSHA